MRSQGNTHGDSGAGRGRNDAPRRSAWAVGSATAGTTGLAGRRGDERRPCRAIVWKFNEDLDEAVEFGRALNLSTGGLCMVVAGQETPGSDMDDDEAGIALRAGQEWLVLLDDPSGEDHEADHRPALLRVVWTRRILHAKARIDGTTDGEETLVGCAFVKRESGRCGRHRRGHAPATELVRLSDRIGGEMLDELAERITREIPPGEPDPHPTPLDD